MTEPLFPNLPTQDVPLNEQPWKKRAYPRAPGTGPENETCGSCRNFVRVIGNTHDYFKCGLMKRAHSVANDIKKSALACEFWADIKPEVEHE